MPSLPYIHDVLKSLLPIINWLPHYNWQKLRQDTVAGLTVALMVIPQGLAYAQVAELPVQYGLYSSFMGPFVYCLFGSSKDTTLGPTAIMALVTATYNLAPGPAPKSPTYAVLMCLACGIVQFLVGLLRLGPIVNFISLPVVGAFTTSAAITIAWGQVKSLLGMRNISNSLPISVYQILRNITLTNHWDLIMGITCMFVLLVLMKFQRDVTFKPGEDGENSFSGVHRTRCVKLSRAFVRFICSGRNALVVTSAGLVAFALKTIRLHPLSLTPKVHSGLPPFKLPEFQLTNGTHVLREFLDILSDIGIGFAVIPFIGLVEAIAISRVFARIGNYKVNASQELIAIGISNIAGSFVSAFPVTGSFSRTAINYQSGVKTPAGGIVTGCIVLLALALLGELFHYIPQSALAAVIIIAVIQMTDFRLLYKLWFVSKTGFIEWCVTFVFSILLGLEIGILLGIAISFAFLLYAYNKPDWDLTTRPSGLVVLTLKSEVRFPAAEWLQMGATNAITEGSSLCIDLTPVSGMDYAIVDALLHTKQTLQLTSKSLYIVSSNPIVTAGLQHVGLLVFQSLDFLERELASNEGISEVSPLL